MVILAVRSTIGESGIGSTILKWNGSITIDDGGIGDATTNNGGIGSKRLNNSSADIGDISVGITAINDGGIGLIYFIII